MNQFKNKSHVSTTLFLTLLYVLWECCQIKLSVCFCETERDWEWETSNKLLAAVINVLAIYVDGTRKKHKHLAIAQIILGKHIDICVVSATQDTRLPQIIAGSQRRKEVEAS